MMDKWKRAGTVVAVVGLALTSAVTAAGASENATSGGSVKVFVTGPFSDPTFAVPEALSGAQAAAAAINKAGGINGHSIQIVSCNDQLSPNSATTCADQAVRDHVTAGQRASLSSGPMMTGRWILPASHGSSCVPVTPQGGTSTNLNHLSAGNDLGLLCRREQAGQRGLQEYRPPRREPAHRHRQRRVRHRRDQGGGRNGDSNCHGRGRSS